ncbi:MAG: ABC transporter permease [Chloroflexi bacterium]|nr:ABC transporter permease [Chloroflexota bacterium]
MASQGATRSATRSEPGLLRSAAHVLEYCLLAYRRSFRASLFSSFVQPTLFLAAMGLGLGGIVDRSGAAVSLGGVSYLAFLAPGLLASAGMQTAFSEGTYRIVAAINWVRTYFAMIATPVTPRAIAVGEIAFILFRLWIVTGIFSLVTLAFGVDRSPGGFILAWAAAILTGLAFATPIAAYSATRRNAESFNALFRFGMTPLFLFSGTFFPIERLPAFLQLVAALTPLYHGVALTRGLALGTLDPGTGVVHIAYLATLAAAGTVACLVTFQRRLVS